MMKLPWSKKVKKMETKSTAPLTSFINYLFDSGHADLSAYVATDLYSRVGPLATAVNIITDGLAQLKPVLIKDDEVIKEHEVLTLLNRPNQDQTGTEFMKRFSALFLISGDNFTVAQGQVNKPPLALWIPTPSSANITRDGFGEPGQIVITKGSNTFTFVKDDKWRFYDGPLREVWHTKAFNPHTDTLYGQSILTPIFFDIEQYREASTHNLSLLKRGARPSGVFLAKDTLTDDQFTRLKEQIDNYYTGSSQAGRPILADGENIDYKDMMMSARDMDFLKLKENVTIAIFNHLKIPLPLVSPDNQSYANMQAANLQLYSNAILPLADRIYEELSMFLLPRYNGTEGMRLSYDRSQIDALELATAESLKLRSKTGIHTINELRALDGFESVDDGDVILRPANELPVANDRFTEDNLDKPNRKKFFALMEGKGYSDEELNIIANEHGLN